MDKLEYNILLEETGVYGKRKLDKEEAITQDCTLIYEESETKDRFEILPSELSPEEIKIALLAKQTKELGYISSKLTAIVVMLIIPFIIGFIMLLSGMS